MRLLLDWLNDLLRQRRQRLRPGLEAATGEPLSHIGCGGVLDEVGEGRRQRRTGLVPADRGGRWMARLVWAFVWLLFVAAAVLYIAESSTLSWYVAVAGLLRREKTSRPTSGRVAFRWTEAVLRSAHHCPDVVLDNARPVEQR